MIDAEEEKFYQQWEKDRLLPHFKRKPFLKGLSMSLLFGILILGISELGWYERANMIANRSGNGIWMIIAIVIISFGFGWIYQQFTFEMNEQRFHEIKHLKNKK
jgi:putative copper export protein